MPRLAREICDVGITVILDQVVHDPLCIIIVVREYGREILALLVNEKHGALASLVDDLLEAVRETRRLQCVCHHCDGIKFLIRNEREYRSLADLSYSAVLVFEITAEDDHIDIVLERSAHEALDKLSLIIFISLSKQQSYSFSISHKRPSATIAYHTKNRLRY